MLRLEGNELFIGDGDVTRLCFGNEVRSGQDGMSR